MNVLHFIFGICGNATALFLFLSPTVTFKRIMKKKSTEQFSGIPYVMTLLNCLLSTWYGLPFISPNNILLSTIDGTGGVISIIFVGIFIIYSPTNKDKLKIFSLSFLVLLVFGCVALVSLLVLHGNQRRVFCGVTASVFATAMYASPLSIMRVVTKTKSVEYMPFWLSMFVFLCGTSWFAFGLLGRDPFIVIPNGFGCGLGAMQLILYFIYYDNNPTPAPKDTTHDDLALAEMGIHAQNKLPV